MICQSDQVSSAMREIETALIAMSTAWPNGPVPAKADHIITFPAQTMANDIGSPSILPMDTAYEIAMLTYLDLSAHRLAELTIQTLGDRRVCHFNLE